MKNASTLCAIIASVATVATPALAASSGAAGSFTVAVTQRVAANVSVHAAELGTVAASGVLRVGTNGSPIVAAYAAETRESLGVDTHATISSVRDERGTVTVQVRLPADAPGVLIVASAT